MNWSKFSWSCLLAVLGVGSSVESALASGFAISEQSVSGLGNAFSGAGAIAEDASTIFFNPAGLTLLKGNSLVGAGSLIIPSINFTNQGSVTVTGQPLSGGNGGNPGKTVLIPNLYTSWSLSEEVKLGLGVNSPFGLVTEFEEGWVGRYQGLRSSLTTININPTVAVRLAEMVSFGFGLNVQYADAELSNAIDFGTIGANTPLQTTPQQLDGKTEVNGDDWSVGFNLGLLLEPTPRTRVGLAYRSAITHDLRGNAKFTVPEAATPLTAQGQFTNTDAKAELNLPDSFSLSVYQELSNQWAIMGDLTWTNWSRFQELRVEFDNPVQSDSVQPQNWRDTWRFGLGLNYKPSEKWLLRTGFAFDPSPAEDEFNSVRIPTGNRTWLSFGVGYRPSRSLNFDFGYAHIFAPSEKIAQVEATGSRLKGELDGSANILGLQINWRF